MTSRKRTLLSMAAAWMIFSGCAEKAAVFRTYSSSIRTDVFQEVASGSPAVPGSADLTLTATVKTHKPGAHYTLDAHGTPDYKLLLNIDGQALLISGLLQQADEPVRLQDPEGGEGIRYRFDKKLRLKPGSHKMVIAVPEDDIAIEKELTLPDGALNKLVLEPIYYSAAETRGFHSAGTFREGVRGFRITLNGRQI